MTIRTDFPFSVVEQDDYQITLKDGCVLSARVWMPQGTGPFPAVLEFLPYRKRDGTAVRDEITHPYFAGCGYASFRVDMRGNGESDGIMDDEYSPQELADAVEVIEFIAAQSWSNGAVGMMGISWGGFNALQVAALDPAPLKAIITLCSTVDRYADDIHYKGNCLLNENLGWGATMWSYSSRPPDPLLRTNWREMWLERLEKEPFLPAVWLEHQSRDAYWQHGSVCEDYSAIKAATLAVGGWGDSYKNAVGALVDNLAAPVKGIIGPWVHKYPHFAVPEPRIGFLQEAVRWWDQWLKGEERGVMDDPPLRVFVLDSERPQTSYNERQGLWVSLDTYPKPDRIIGFNNLPQKLASPVATGSAGGEYCPIWLGPELPGDQRVDDAYSLCHDSEPLVEECTIIGRPKLRFSIKAVEATAKVAVRLCDVAPNGESVRITYGLANLSQCSFENGVVRGEIELDAIAYRVAKGNRLRIAISNHYWPLIWPSATDTELMVQEAEMLLPIADSLTPITMLAPEGAPPLGLNTLRNSSHIRRTEIDQQSGEVRLVIEDDFGKYENQTHGLITGSIARELWSIGTDVHSAYGWCHWTQEMERNSIALRTETLCDMRSDADNFYLTAELYAYENEALIFEKKLDYAIPREGQ